MGRVMVHRAPRCLACRERIRTMDPNFLLLALVLVVLFASISIVGALHRIRNASEKTLAILEAQIAEKAATD